MFLLPHIRYHGSTRTPRFGYDNGIAMNYFDYSGPKLVIPTKYFKGTYNFEAQAIKTSPIDGSSSSPVHVISLSQDVYEPQPLTDAAITTFITNADTALTGTRGRYV